MLNAVAVSRNGHAKGAEYPSEKAPEKANKASTPRVLRDTRNPLAEALRKAVKESKESVLSIARKADIPQPVLWRFMAGQQDLTLSTASRLALYLGIAFQVKE